MSGLRQAMVCAAVAAGLTMMMGTTAPSPVMAADVKIASDNPLSGDPEAIAKGRKIYGTFCAQCHGGKADGVAPRFGKYSADLRRFNKGFYEFAGIVAVGIPEKQMPPWGTVFQGDEISQIGAYLETLAITEGKRPAKWAVEE